MNKKIIFILVILPFIIDIFAGTYCWSLIFAVIPVILLILCNLIIKNTGNKMQRIMKKFINIVIPAFLVTVNIVYILSYLFIADRYPFIWQYQKELEILSENKEAIKHFPSEIPQNVKNYMFFKSKTGMFNYLSFNIDKDYIENVKKNNNDIFRILKFNKICSTYVLFCDKIKDKDFGNADFYILNNSDNDYTSGYAISDKNNKILFFYSPENLSVQNRNIGTYYPPEDEYIYELQLITKNKYRINHFPKIIPANAKNYVFGIENYFDGYNISYLKFNISDDKYLKNIITSNKDRIYKKVNYGKAQSCFRDINIHFDSIISGKKQEYELYVLKNENSDYGYTSGIIISEKQKEIIFFYANYCLDNTKNVSGVLLN